MKEVTVLVAAPMKQAQGQTMPVKGTGVHIPKKQTSFLKKKKKNQGYLDSILISSSHTPA